jgi:hypothetical protein
MHCVESVLPWGEYEFVAHGVHETVRPTVSEYVEVAQFEHPAAPVVSLYCPAEQAVQAAPFAPVYPLLHVQLDKATLPSGVFEFDGQSSQVLAKVVQMVSIQL